MKTVTVNPEEIRKMLAAVDLDKVLLDAPPILLFASPECGSRRKQLNPKTLDRTHQAIHNGAHTEPLVPSPAVNWSEIESLFVNG